MADIGFSSFKSVLCPISCARLVGGRPGSPGWPPARLSSPAAEEGGNPGGSPGIEAPRPGTPGSPAGGAPGRPGGAPGSPPGPPAAWRQESYHGHYNVGGRQDRAGGPRQMGAGEAIVIVTTMQ